MFSMPMRTADGGAGGFSASVVQEISNAEFRMQNADNNLHRIVRTERDVLPEFCILHSEFRDRLLIDFPPGTHRQFALPRS
jgi:hypothetical protein